MTPIRDYVHRLSTTVLTDNGCPFADESRYREGSTAPWHGERSIARLADRLCWEHEIEHRLTKPYRPWNNGNAEPMNRTINDGHGEAFEALACACPSFVAACHVGFFGGGRLLLAIVRRLD